MSMGDLEFRPTTESDWREKIAADLKGLDPAEALLWRGDPGIVLDAVSTRDSGYQFPEQHFSPGLEWEILEYIGETGRDDIAEIDIRPSVPLAGSLSNQCAIAAAALEQRIAAAEAVQAVRAVVPVGTRIFLEVGKLRALRQLLMDIRVSADGGLVNARNEPSSPTEASAQADPGGVTLWSVAGDACECPDRQTHQIRLTYACIAAILGGSDAILPTPFDSTEDSARLARNVLLILRHESGLARLSTIPDGSYYVNQVSRKIYDAAKHTLAGIRSAGGLRNATDSGELAAILSSARSRAGTHV